jgi:putative membrane protein
MIARRTVVAALATAATTPVFAQNQMTRAASGETPGPAETRLIQQTLPIGALSLAVSRVAEPKVRAPRLREFARFEIAEQETVADVLKSLQNPGAPVSGTVTPPSDADLEPHLDARARETLQKMRSARAGAEFDREYIDAQTDGHQQLLRIQEDYLKSGRNLGAVNFSKMASGMIKEHLQLLSDLKSETG